jgi:hypothetical protein
VQLLYQQNQIKDIVKPQPVVGNKEKHPTLLRGKVKQICENGGDGQSD